MRKKTQKSKFLSLWLGIFVVGILAIGGYMVAFSGNSPSTVFEGDCVDCTLEAVESASLGGVGEDAFFGGASRFPRSYLYAGEGMYVDPGDGFRIGTLDNTAVNGAITDGYKSKLITLTITNTSSAGILNPEGESIYVYDASYRIQSATTTPYRLTIGTSTQAFIVPDNSALDFPDVNGGDQSIFLLATDVIANASPDTATSTNFRADNLGLDTRDGSGVQNVITVLADEYITCYASTTPDLDSANPPMGTFQGQCQIKYYVVED